MAEYEEDYIPVYMVIYNIPSEDGLFFVERSLPNGNKIKLYIGVREIRNRMKYMRFKFYEILKKYGVLKTKIGRIVDSDSAPYLRLELEEWRKDFLALQRQIDRFVEDPLSFPDGDFVIKQVRKYGLKWPPKDLNITDTFFMKILGPIRLPRKLYMQLVIESLTNLPYINEEGEDQ